jgi:hypothetical protein
MKKQNQQDPFGIQEVIEIISNSAIPDSRKLVYLYSIANGTFNQDHLEDLSKDLRDAGTALEAEKQTREQRVKKMEKQIKELDEQLDALAVQRALEYEKKVTAYVQDVAKEVEKDKEAQKLEQAKTLRKKLK